MIAASTTSRSKPLAELVAGFAATDACIDVCGLALDSRRVRQGDLFLACRGQQVDGRAFIADAVASGAVAVLADDGEGEIAAARSAAVPVMPVAQLSDHVSEIAGRFYDHPSHALSLVGVTGTNGKTTCTHLVMQLLNAMQQRCGVIGTLGTGLDGAFEAGINTTPDALSIQRWLADWRDAGVQMVAMEVSSHGLVQGRVAALRYRVAVFTNLTRDHLDYHGSMESYGEAKAQLFRRPELDAVVLNADDAFSAQLQGVLQDGVRCYRYSVADSRADVWLEQVQYHRAGVEAHLHTPWGSGVLKSPLLGAFNVSNLLAVITALGAMGYPLEALLAAAPTLHPVAGRMDRLADTVDIDVVIDYAHTPDGLREALAAMRLHTRGKLWCVFGCGGDRDKGKRPQMGVIAEQLADAVVVTSDNPRSESPTAIIGDIVAGFAAAPAIVEADRAGAIALTIARAAPGDAVLIAGKGHEDYQQIGSQRLPFSDCEQARLALARRAGV